jgi:hypothetical protein
MNETDRQLTGIARMNGIIGQQQTVPSCSSCPSLLNTGIALLEKERTL